MTVRPRRIVVPGPTEPAQMFRGATPFSASGASAPVSEESGVLASGLLLPPRLLLPPSTTVRRSLWVFRTPKRELLKD